MPFGSGPCTPQLARVRRRSYNGIWGFRGRVLACLTHILEKVSEFVLGMFRAPRCPGAWVRWQEGACDPTAIR